MIGKLRKNKEEILEVYFSHSKPPVVTCTCKDMSMKEFREVMDFASSVAQVWNKRTSKYFEVELIT